MATHAGERAEAAGTSCCRPRRTPAFARAAAASQRRACRPHGCAFALPAGEGTRGGGHHYAHDDTAEDRHVRPRLADHAEPGLEGRA